MKLSAAGTLLAFLLLSANAEAQTWADLKVGPYRDSPKVGPYSRTQPQPPDFGELPVKTGDVVYVTEPTGTEIAGRVTTLSSSLLEIDGHQFMPLAGLKIERRGDPLWDGVVIGLLSGFALGALTGMGECGIDWSFGRCALGGAAWGGVFGLLIDWRHTGRRLIYVGQPSGASQAPGARPTPAAKAITIGGAFRY